MKRTSFCGLALVAFAACADTSLPVSGPTVAMTQSRAINADQTIGTSTTLVRTFIKDAEGNRTEISGVTCRLRSDQLSAQVITPQNVAYPTFLQAARFEKRGLPDALVVTCSNGDRSGTQVMPPVTQGSARPQPGTTTTTSGSTTVSTSLVPLTGNISSSYPWTFPARLDVEIE
ncbi:hypothetical protein BC777_2565 [Yoonia maricola]|uniref:Lipoprotein n=1 Tax=Yoonia maricola TaxID=420999 RepID=A0A2M8W5K7_9RHOB|nr:hypothetical protein [Yoonia maricola]PJI86200.1 hypothetical protein BC777_2565 [Yoonia maricola]